MKQQGRSECWPPWGKHFLCPTFLKVLHDHNDCISYFQTAYRMPHISLLIRPLCVIIYGIGCLYFAFSHLPLTRCWVSPETWHLNKWCACLKAPSNTDVLSTTVKSNKRENMHKHKTFSLLVYRYMLKWRYSQQRCFTLGFNFALFKKRIVKVKA